MRLHNFRFLALALVLILPPTAIVFAQDPMVPPEGVTPESDWLYGKHLDQVNGIMKENGPERESPETGELHEEADSKAKIRPYMEGFFLQTAEEMQKAGKTQDEPVMAKVTELFPNSPAVKSQQFMAAFQAKDYQKTITTRRAELNAANPTRRSR